MSRTISGAIAAVIAACALAGCGSSENAQIVGVPVAAPSVSANPAVDSISGFQQAQSQQLGQAIHTVGVAPRVKQPHAKLPHIKLPH